MEAPLGDSDSASAVVETVDPGWEDLLYSKNWQPTSKNHLAPENTAEAGGTQCAGHDCKVERNWSDCFLSPCDKWTLQVMLTQ